MCQFRFIQLIGMLLVIFLFLSVGCASRNKNNTGAVTFEETKSLFDAAKFTGSATKSPYEFYSAEILLKKAADAKNLGDTIQSKIYLKKAYEQAQIAYENAKRYKRSK